MSDSTLNGLALTYDAMPLSRGKIGIPTYTDIPYVGMPLATTGLSDLASKLTAGFQKMVDSDRYVHLGLDGQVQSLRTARLILQNYISSKIDAGSIKDFNIVSLQHCLYTFPFQCSIGCNIESFLINEITSKSFFLNLDPFMNSVVLIELSKFESANHCCLDSEIDCYKYFCVYKELPTKFTLGDNDLQFLVRNLHNFYSSSDVVSLASVDGNCKLLCFSDNFLNKLNIPYHNNNYKTTPPKAVKSKLFGKRLIYNKSLFKAIYKYFGINLDIDNKIFPHDSVLSKIKCNVFLKDIIMSIVEAEPSRLYQPLECMINLVYNSTSIVAVGTNLAETISSNIRQSNINHNMICGFVISYWTLMQRETNSNVRHIFGALYSSLVLKRFDITGDVSDIIKSSGCVRYKYFYLLCEMRCLAGKSFDSTDIIEADFKHRVSTTEKGPLRVIEPGKVKANDVDCVVLAQAVNQIYTEHLGNVVNIKIDLDKTWNNRWATCKGGAHKTRDEQEILGRLTTTVDLPTRRNFIEDIEQNILFKTEPKCLITPSIKHENGKNRIIYSCDTINYLNFDAIITPIERLWRDTSVCLQPGSDNKINDYRKLSERNTDYCLSLDYSDFNSQHTIKNCQVVIRVLERFIDKKYIDWCVQSWAYMYLNYKSKRYRWVNTLPSGHRLTSFINSVLNKAYLLISIQSYATLVKYSIHVGDDCVLFCSNCSSTDQVVAAIKDSNITVNNSKQSLGTTCEFLRVSFDRLGGLGYVNRSIASLVSGNWTNSYSLGMEEYTQMLDEYIWTLRNRTLGVNPIYLSMTLARRLGLGLSVCKSILIGESSINKGVSIYHGGVSYDYEFKYERNSTFKKYKGGGYATKDFIEKVISTREHEFFKHYRLHGLIKNAMLKAGLVDKTFSTAHSVSRKECVFSSNVINVDRLVMPTMKEGVLTTRLPFAFLKRVLKDYQLREILRLLDLDYVEVTSEVLWGTRANYCSGRVGVPYATMRSVSSVFGAGKVITTSYPLYV